MLLKPTLVHTPNHQTKILFAYSYIIMNNIGSGSDSTSKFVRYIRCLKLITNNNINNTNKRIEILSSVISRNGITVLIVIAAIDIEGCLY